ncbi:MAG: hypothetical protein K2J93_05365, partial [Anaeroplasmataceae bacterium]|nr:hypothetical protein [Anaeroplasmataceae bacterium]
MINQGLKDYTRQISQSIGEVASVYVNLNQEAANMDIVIPGFATQGPNPIEISLIYNFQDRDKDEGFFGKGCHLNFYKSFENGKDYIIIKEADGSKIEYNYNASLNAFKSLESKLTVYRTIVEDEENGNWYQYVIQDVDGNKIFYNEGYCYPTLIEYKTGEKIVFEGMVMNNGHGGVVYCQFQGSRVKTILYKQDNISLYSVDIGYDTSQRINSVKHYMVKNGNEKN